MQDNTYDVPSYKFGFMLPNHPIEIEDDADYIDNLMELKNDSFFVVPFETFDGLTVEEMLKAIRSHGIQFICYSEYFNPVTRSNVITPYYTLFLRPSYLKNEVLYRRIDKVIELKLLNEYKNMSFQRRKVVECYLERYMCGSHKETQDKIFKLRSTEQNHS